MGGTGVAGLDFLNLDHPYAADLDLFGQGSLFERLCTARTKAGEAMLACVAPRAGRPGDDRRAARGHRRAAAPARPPRGPRAARRRGPDRNRPRCPRGLVRRAAGLRRLGGFRSSRSRWPSSARPPWSAGCSSDRDSSRSSWWSLVDLVFVALSRAGCIGSSPTSTGGRTTWSCSPSYSRDSSTRPFQAPLLRRLRAAMAAEGTPASSRIRRLARLARPARRQPQPVLRPLRGALALDDPSGSAIDAWRATPGPRSPGGSGPSARSRPSAPWGNYAAENPADPFPELVAGPGPVRGRGARPSADPRGSLHPQRRRTRGVRRGS